MGSRGQEKANGCGLIRIFSLYAAVKFRLRFFAGTSGSGGDFLPDSAGEGGPPVALRVPSVPTALTYGDESTLKTLNFCIDNG